MISFVKILEKGDIVERKESKKKFLDILNYIDQDKDEQAINSNT